MSRIIIGVTGYAQHGKDSVAHVLKECVPNLERHGFADALRNMALALDPIIIPSSLKDASWRYSEVVDAYGYEDAKQLPEVRRYLQRLGTEAVRGVLGENVWVDAFARTIDALPAERSVVITDVRFPNEADYVQSVGQLWSVTRYESNGSPFDNGVSTEHPSEAYIAALKERADVRIEAASVRDLELSVKAQCWGVTKVERAQAVPDGHIAGWYGCSCVACEPYLQEVTGWPV